MKFRPLLICLLLSNNIFMHAVQFDKGPFIQVYSVMSVLPWQKMFNVGIMGALGWFGYENWQLKKKTFPTSFKPELYLTKDAADKTYVKQEQIQEFATTKQLTDIGNLYITKTQAEETYYTRKEGMDEVRAAVVDTFKGTFETYFVKKAELPNLLTEAWQEIFASQVAALQKSISACAKKEDVVALQQAVTKCVTREELATLQQTLGTKTDLTDVEKRMLQQLNENKQEQTKNNDQLTLTLRQGLEHINTTIQGLASNQEFIQRLAPNVAGLLTQEDDQDDTNKN